MTDKQIEEKLQEIEDRNPQWFKQFKLKDHIYWSHVPGTKTIKWGIHAHFLGNLPIKLKTEVSKIMNKLTKGGYQPAKEEGQEDIKVQEQESKAEEKSGEAEENA